MPHLNCPPGTVPKGKNSEFQWVVFHWRLHWPRRASFIASHLRYAPKLQVQYLVAVKLSGSFRLGAGMGRLYPPRIFTGRLPETVSQW